MLSSASCCLSGRDEGRMFAVAACGAVGTGCRLPSQGSCCDLWASSPLMPSGSLQDRRRMCLPEAWLSGPSKQPFFASSWPKHVPSRLPGVNCPRDELCTGHPEVPVPPRACSKALGSVWPHAEQSKAVHSTKIHLISSRWGVLLP